MLLLAMLALAATPGRAQPVAGYLSAGSLLAKCRGSSVEGKSYCFAYIAAVADSARAYQAWLDSRDICLADGVQQSELVRAYENYMATHPASTSAQAASIVVLSLRDAYPCAADERAGS